MLRNVVISVPCSNEPDVRASSSECRYDGSSLQWHVPEISSENVTGNVELFCAGVEPAALHPISITFDSDSSFSGMTVDSVEARDEDGEEPSYECNVSLVPSRYHIVGGE